MGDMGVKSKIIVIIEISCKLIERRVICYGYMEYKLTKEQVHDAIRTLDCLCRKEYGENNQYGLVDLLSDPDEELSAARLQRLCGLILKKNFATPIKLKMKSVVTKANNGWKWDLNKFEDKKLQQTQEFWVLNQLREWLPTYDSYRKSTWDDLRDEADTERGLYKISTLWIQDKWKGCETKSIRDYLEQEESPRFEAVLNIAEWVSQEALAIALSSIIPVPTFIVPLSIIGARYGYRKITEAPNQRDDIDNRTLTKNEGKNG